MLNYPEVKNIISVTKIEGATTALCVVSILALVVLGISWFLHHDITLGEWFWITSCIAVMSLIIARFSNWVVKQNLIALERKLRK